jgi:hypothetical protein
VRQKSKQIKIIWLKQDTSWNSNHLLRCLSESRLWCRRWKQNCWSCNANTHIATIAGVNYQQSVENVVTMRQNTLRRLSSGMLHMPHSLVGSVWHSRDAYCLHHQDNVSKFLQDYMVQHPKRWAPSYSLSWEPKILPTFLYIFSEGWCST